MSRFRCLATIVFLYLLSPIMQAVLTASEATYEIPLYQIPQEFVEFSGLAKMPLTDFSFSSGSSTETRPLELSYTLPPLLVGDKPLLKVYAYSNMPGRVVSTLPSFAVRLLVFTGPCWLEHEGPQNGQPGCKDEGFTNSLLQDSVITIGKGRCHWTDKREKDSANLSCEMNYSNEISGGNWKEVQMAEVIDPRKRQFLEGLAQTFAHDAVGILKTR